MGTIRHDLPRYFQSAIGRSRVLWLVFSAFSHGLKVKQRGLLFIFSAGVIENYGTVGDNWLMVRITQQITKMPEITNIITAHLNTPRIQRPKLVYFDKNIYNQIKKQFLITSADYELIKRAINIGVIIVPGSITVLEEALGIYRSKSKGSLAIEKQVLSELIDWKLFIKAPRDLLFDEIMGYINDVPFNPFTRYPITPEKLYTEDPKQVADWINVEAETEAQKLAFIDGLKPVREQFRKQMLQIPKQNRKMTFPRLWQERAHEFAAEYVSRYCALKKVQKKGIEGLLDRRVLRLTVGYDLAYFFKKFILDAKMSSSDSRDHHHVALSSVTDIFVTQDGPLANLLSLVPMENYTVWSYRQFMSWLRLVIDSPTRIPSSVYKKAWVR